MKAITVSAIVLVEVLLVAIFETIENSLGLANWVSWPFVFVIGIVGGVVIGKTLFD